MQQEVKNLLPKLHGPQARVLGEWVYAMLLVDSCGLTRISSFLSALGGQSSNTVRQRLREVLYEAGAKAGVKKRGMKRRELVVEEHFADLLRGIVKQWQGPPKLVLALDASTLADRFDVLSLSVVTHGGGLRVAWKILRSHEEGAWRGHWERLLQTLKEAVPAEWNVLVLADRGLYAAWLFDAIVANGWHPVLRVRQDLSFQQAGEEQACSLGERVKQAGSRWKGEGCWSVHGERRQGTGAIRWEKGYEEPICVVTDVAPKDLEVSLYQMRFWIEAEYKDGKRGWFHWEQSKMTDPQRASRLWLALGIALQMAMGLGIALEKQQDREDARRKRQPKAGRSPRRVGRPPKPQRRPRGREQSVLLRGVMALRAFEVGAHSHLPKRLFACEARPLDLFALSRSSRSYEEKKKRQAKKRRQKQRRAGTWQEPAGQPEVRRTQAPAGPADPGALGKETRSMPQHQQGARRSQESSVSHPDRERPLLRLCHGRLLPRSRLRHGEIPLQGSPPPACGAGP